MQPIHHSFNKNAFLRRNIALAVAVPTILPVLLSSGCRRPPEPVKPQPTPKPVTVSEADIQKHKPNEAGAIMVIMYHRFRADERSNDLNRTPDEFRKDLETLHAQGYYPVNARNLVYNKMDVPIGKTPVVITFDDSLPTQFRIVSGSDGEPHIDPDSAVGIMETFSKKNPDWPMRATFFVLPKEGRNSEPFGQAEYVSDKFAYLIKNGYEVANHTSTHTSIRGMPVSKLQWELGTAVKDIKAIAPEATMDTLALPYGKYPRDKAAQAALRKGGSGDMQYMNKAVFLAAWRPILSPVTKNDKKISSGGEFGLYDPAKLERVTPDSRNAKAPGTLEYWLAYFKKNPSLKYVSDGNAEICVVPPSHKDMVNLDRLKVDGQRLQVYGATAPKGKSTAGGLSVE